MEERKKERRRQYRIRQDGVEHDRRGWYCMWYDIIEGYLSSEI